MASSGRLDRLVCRSFEDEELSVCICVMSGFSIWILINGFATDQFLVRAVMGAEAERMKVLGGEQDEHGEILVAATQTEETSSETIEKRLNQLIRFGTAECVREAADLLE